MFRLVTYIRKLSLGVLFIVCIAITESYAGDATLSWTASKDSNVAGYKLYYGTVSHSYTSSINVGLQTTATVTGLNAGVYYFAVTAYNSAGAESGFSNEASKTIAGTPSSSDTEPPLVSLTAPAGGTTLTGATVISASASDNVGIAGVQFLLDGSSIGQEVTSSPFSLSWDSATANNGTHSLSARARDARGNQTIASSINVTTSNTTTTSSKILVDFGKDATSNSFGLPGWSTVLRDNYTENRNVGPGGMTIVIGSNPTYNYQGLKGSSRAFVAGEKIVVTWYNNSSTKAIFTPGVSFTDANRRYVDPSGAWYEMSSVAIAPFSSAKSEYSFSSRTAGSFSLVNVNINYSNNQAVICDKIELVSGGTPPPLGSALPAPKHVRVK
jgi:hypothetical protein